MKKSILILTFSFISLIALFSQKTEVLRFSVEAGKYQRNNTPVSLDLAGIVVNDSLSLQLFEQVKGKPVEVPCQIESGYTSRLWWIMNSTTPAASKRDYILYSNHRVTYKNSISAEVNSENIHLKKDKTKILDYQISLIYPPAGVDTMYKRNGFIHPVYAPSGNILTRINPPDHYHHVGIWNPWTRVKTGNHVTDFWNLYLHQGTVKFAGVNSITDGPVFGGFAVRQEHIDFQGKNCNELTFNEVWDVRAWNTEPVAGTKAWLVDLTVFLSVAGDSAIILEAYRYGGGIGFRSTDEWNKDNSWVNTSEGKTRANADGTKARWADVGGLFKEKGTSGIVFFSHPSNREHPEPMRVWPENQNVRGDVFFEFCPIRFKDWVLNPGNLYRLKYRMLVYDGKVDPEVSERIWTDFAYPPVVKAGNSKK
ncbi:MAG: hypothetical protein C0408_08655 [Odoribacter sp.]|nr:hypothetical protein [Odoribacter sp.]